jgi:hypothetical protein
VGVVAAEELEAEDEEATLDDEIGESEYDMMLGDETAIEDRLDD